jgi:hypothetical protein
VCAQSVFTDVAYKPSLAKCGFLDGKATRTAVL